jgi:hypothetical protein
MLNAFDSRCKCSLGPIAVCAIPALICSKTPTLGEKSASASKTRL